MGAKKKRIWTSCRKRVVGQTGSFRHQPDNSPSSFTPEVFCFPTASCHHLCIESSDGRVYFSLSQESERKIETERERVSGFARPQETCAVSTFNKTLSSFSVFLSSKSWSLSSTLRIMKPLSHYMLLLWLRNQKLDHVSI